MYVRVSVSIKSVRCSQQLQESSNEGGMVYLHYRTRT
jgi:hypothetical protein